MIDYIDIYNDSTYLLNNPTWDEEDSVNDTMKNKLKYTLTHKKNCP